jgi:hypothetical protein
MKTFGNTRTSSPLRSDGSAESIGSGPIPRSRVRATFRASGELSRNFTGKTLTSVVPHKPVKLPVIRRKITHYQLFARAFTQLVNTRRFAMRFAISRRYAQHARHRANLG